MQDDSELYLQEVRTMHATLLKGSGSFLASSGEEGINRWPLTCITGSFLSGTRSTSSHFPFPSVVPSRRPRSLGRGTGTRLTAAPRLSFQKIQLFKWAPGDSAVSFDRLSVGLWYSCITILTHTSYTSSAGRQRPTFIVLFRVGKSY